MVDSTNPRIMADNIKDLNTATIRNAKDIATGSEILESEFDTGKKDKDGNIIYGNKFNITLPEIASDGTSVNDSKTLPIKELFSVNVFAKGTTQIFPVMYTTSSNYFIKWYYSITHASFNVQANATVFSKAVVTFVVEYTKSAAPTPNVLPSPDPDIRALAEPEPEPIEEKK